MNRKSMDVFSLRDSVVGEYEKFARSFTTIHAADIRAQVEQIYADGRFWPDPLIQINPSYRRGKGIEERIASGALDPRTADPCHRRLSDENALANSQLEELDKFVGNVKGEKSVTFGRYTGQETSEERDAIASDPPDILLTNFMMLELLMTRQDSRDRKVIGNCTGLSFLDQYRGRARREGRLQAIRWSGTSTVRRFLLDEYSRRRLDPQERRARCADPNELRLRTRIEYMSALDRGTAIGGRPSMRLPGMLPRSSRNVCRQARRRVV